MGGVWEQIRRWVVGAEAPPAEASDTVAAACAEDVVPGLVRALASASPQVARAAAAALRKLGPEAIPAIPALLGLASSPIPSDAKDLVQHEHARSDAMYALGDLLALVERLRDATGRRRAAEPPDDEPPLSTVELLLLGTRDAEPNIRATAWVGLVQYLDDPRVRHAARAALDDADVTVRRTVVATLTPRLPVDR
jgi:HEAT repeat protein